MQEVVGNLWDLGGRVRCITTNGTVKKNGECVMGRGCAWEAKQMFPGIALLLGQKIAAGGNVPHILINEEPNLNEEGRNYKLISFPVKHHWYERADLDLIAESARRLKAIVGYANMVYIPRPGCGNGGLKWPDVKAVLEPIFDTPYFAIVSQKGEK